jgi:hypothetical protein
MAFRFKLTLVILTLTLSCNVYEEPGLYRITAEAGAHGRIEPSGEIQAHSGDTVRFIIVPDSQYIIAGVTVDGVPAGAVTSYMFAPVSADHTIRAGFTRNAVLKSQRDARIQYIGRFDTRDTGKVRFAWPGSTIRAVFTGPYCALRLRQVPVPGLSENLKYNASYYAIFIDGTQVDTVVRVTVADTMIVVAERLTQGTHTVTVFKRTEAFCGTGEFLGLYLDRGNTLSAPPARARRRMEFIGNSITCGYGNEGDATSKFTGATENCYQTYAAITARNCNAECHLIAYSGRGLFLNADSSTTRVMPDLYSLTLPEDSASSWNYTSWIPDAVVINLGENDFGTPAGVPDSVTFIESYRRFIANIFRRYPRTTVFLIDGPMHGYTVIDTVSGARCSSNDVLRTYIQNAAQKARSSGYRNIFTFSLSETDTLTGFGAEGHPNVAQHTRNAAELTSYIRKTMGW